MRDASCNIDVSNELIIQMMTKVEELEKESWGAATMTAKESNAHKCPPIPEGLARGTLLLLEKKLSKHGFNFDCKAYIGEAGTQCIQVYVDNTDDPDDHEDFHYDVTQVKSPAELYAQVREDLAEIYDL